MVIYSLLYQLLTANWYEERLAKEQLYRVKPEVRIVSSRSLFQFIYF